MVSRGCVPCPGKTSDVTDLDALNTVPGVDTTLKPARLINGELSLECVRDVLSFAHIFHVIHRDTSYSVSIVDCLVPLLYSWQ